MKSQIKIAFREQKESIQIDGYNPVISQILASRGIKSADDINYKLNTLLSYNSINDIQKAAKIVAEAIMQRKSIYIIADYDADGATSCALCIKAIKAFGNNNVYYIVPSRFSDGYGLSAELVKSCADSGAELIITVDNGITSIAGVDYANQIGLPVIVTDHHLPGGQLPKATALVNPRLGCDDGLLNLAGVGVAFYLVIAIRSELRELGWFTKNGVEELNLASLLDLVALGTVADIAILDKNNRTLVSQGLDRIRHRRCCNGISALLEVSARQFDSVDAGDLGFALGPRLNAAGRLEDMALGIECLLADNYSTAIKVATQLHELNAERKVIEDDMKLEALALLDEQVEQDISSENRLSVCLYRKEWHQGVVGILASRIKDRTHRPTVIFAQGEDGNLKGSARSISGIHIRDIFEAIAAKNPNLILKYGGHAMAAGLSISPSKFEVFTAEFEKQVSNVSSPDMFENMVYVDGELSANDLNMDLAQTISGVGPWGHHFPKPQFYGKFKVADSKILKERHLRLRLQLDNQSSVNAIAFNCIDDEWQGLADEIEIVYQLDINHFRGNSSLQLMVEHLL